MIDTHAHLDDERLRDEAQNIIADMKKDGLDAVINNSCDLGTMRAGLKLAQNNGIWCTVGMHPQFAATYNCEFENEMIASAKCEKVVAVGEIGLDYHYGDEDKKAQKDAFARQLEVADKLKLPVTLHVRDAYADALDVLTAQKKYLNSGVVWHCYSGSAEFASQMVKKDHYFAFGGAITFKNAKKEQVLERIPLERILTETDCPYMTPVPYRGMTNYPKYVRFVLEKIAQAYEKPLSETEEIITANCLAVFPRLKI